MDRHPLTYEACDVARRANLWLVVEIDNGLTVCDYADGIEAIEDSAPGEYIRLAGMVPAGSLSVLDDLSLFAAPVSVDDI